MTRSLITSLFVFSTLLLSAQAPFITTWETLSANDKIIIPIVDGLDYLYSVDWENDGIIDDSLVTKQAEHTYPTAGSHQIAITGTFPGIYINDDSEKEKIISIDQWGDIVWQSMTSSFKGASNLTYTATDVPILSEVNQLTEMFDGATSLDADLSYWDISSIADMSQMLDGTAISTTNYDKLLYRWARQKVLPNVTLGAGGLLFCVSGNSRAKLESQAWNIQDDDMACTGNRPFVTTWRTTSVNEDISIITSPLHSYNYDVDWENDGVVDETNVIGDITHTYAFPGDHQIAIYGSFPRHVGPNYGAQRVKLININQWGDIEWETMEESFKDFHTMNSDAYDIPDLSSVTTMKNMFRASYNFNGDIGEWDVSTINNMEGMFNSAEVFNQDIGGWDVSNVKTMKLMFAVASAFNQNIGGWHVDSVLDMNSMFNFAASFDQELGAWNVSNVTSMEGLFNNASAFNQNIDGWDVDSIQDMTQMFQGATLFNQPLNSWNVSNVTCMRQMFNEASSFNQPLNNWDVSKVENVNEMFSEATSFNQPLSNWNLEKVTSFYWLFRRAETFNQDLSNWDVSHVTNFSGTFRDAMAFNQDLSSWDVSSATSLTYMFGGAQSFNGDISTWDVDSVQNMANMFLGAYVFNRDISGWDVSKINQLESMFRNATSFNQGIGNWDISSATNVLRMFSGASSFNQDLSNWNFPNVTSLNSMFEDATSFNHDIGDWDITKIESMTNMLSESGLSQLNYDNTLTKWSSQLVFPGVVFGADGLIYCNSDVARTSLTTNNNWVITGDTLSCDNAQPCTSLQDNTYVGPTNGSWNIDTHWSLGHIPKVCEDVIIPSGFIITLTDYAECYNIDISVGSIVEIEDYELIVWGL